MLFHSEKATKNTFDQCIFSLCSINHSNFDRSVFTYTEFSKTSIAYSSFRDSQFEGIDHDFDEAGPPLACDFYHAKIDDDIRKVAEAVYCNFQQESFVEFSRESIKELLKVNHLNYLTELSFFLNYLLENNLEILQYRPPILSLFKRLYEQLMEGGNIQMVGNLIQSFTEFPEEIRNQNFLLPAPQNNLPENQAKIILTFTSGERLTFSALVGINGVLSITEHSLFGKSGKKLETHSIQKGSIIQEIIAHIDKVVIYAGALYAATNAALSLIKKGVEIQKIRAETKKLNLESNALERAQNNEEEEKALAEQKAAMKQKKDDFILLIEKKQVITEESTIIAHTQSLDEFLQTQEDTIKRLQKLDKKYTLEEIKLILPNE